MIDQIRTKLENLHETTDSSSASDSTKMTQHRPMRAKHVLRGSSANTRNIRKFLSTTVDTTTTAHKRQQSNNNTLSVKQSSVLGHSTL